MSDSPQILRTYDECKRVYRNETVTLLRTKLKDGLKKLGQKEPVDDSNKINILDSHFFEDDSVIHDLAEDIKRSVLAERCPDGNHDELNVILEGAMLAFLSPVLEANTRTREIAINFMHSTLQTLTHKYESKLEKFLRINALASGQESVLQSFHNETNIKLLAKFDHMKKPGSVSFINGYRKQLQEILAKKSATAPEANGVKSAQVNCLQKIIEGQIAEHIRVLREEVKTVESEEKLQLIHQQSKEIALQKLRSEAYSITCGKSGIAISEIELKVQLFNSCHQVLSELSTTKLMFIITSQSEYEAAVTKYKTEMRKVLNSKQFCNEEDLIADHKRISATVLAQFDSKLGESIKILVKIKMDCKKKLKKKLEDIYLCFSEKWERKLRVVHAVIKTLAETHTSNLEKKSGELETTTELQDYHVLTSERIKESFQVSLPLSIPNPSWHEEVLESLSKALENSYDKLSKEWELQMEVGLREVEKAYMKECEKLSHLTFSFNYHDSACLAAISTCPSSSSRRFQAEARQLLDKRYEAKSSTEPVIVGIDFGARHCRSALFQRGTIFTIPHYDLDGQELDFMASYVGVLDYSNFVGRYAQNILQNSIEFQPPIIYDMKNIIYYWKNLGWIRDLYNWPFAAKVGQDGPIISGQGFEYPVMTIISVLFRKLRENAEKFLRRPVTQCVVVVPHFFDPTQRTNILEAGRIAGWLDVTLLEKYNAAAITLQFYNMRGNNNETWSHKMRKVLLLDFGTDFRFYVVQVFQKEMKLLYVYNWNCRGHLFHKNLVEYCIQQFIKLVNVSIHEMNYDPCAAIVWKRRIAESCTKGMIVLSSKKVVTVEVPNFFRGKELRVVVTRAKFEEINASLFPSVCEQVNKVLDWAEVGKENVSEIISTGGFSRIPKLKQVIKSYFVGIPLNNFDSDPEQVMAYGAAIKGAMVGAERSRLKKARTLSSSI